LTVSCLQVFSKLANQTQIVALKEEENGFTIIEIIAALFLISLLVLWVDSVFIAAVKWELYSRQDTMACNYGSEVLENLRSETSKLDVSNQGQSISELFPEIITPENGMNAIIEQMEPWPGYPHLYTVVVNVIQCVGSNCRCWQFATVIRKQ